MAFDGKGRFIVLDGPDYSGKGTQTRKLVSYLMDHPQDRADKFITVVATREPYMSEHGKQIRELLRTMTDPKEKAAELADLYIKAREVHLTHCVEPALAAGHIVVSDRYWWSTLSYQSAQGVPMEELVKRHAGMRSPDVTFIIMPTLEQMIHRKAQERGRPYDEIFEKSADFMRKVHENYSSMADVMPNENIVYIDGDKSIDAVHRDICEAVDVLIFKKE